MRSMPTSQSQAQVNQLKYQEINFAQYKMKGKMKPSHLTGQSQSHSSQEQQHSRLPQTKILSNPYKLVPSHSTKPVTRT